ncbi:hypothetical protein SLS53_007681 [Cytospora paraplurivora]|uniref:O-methyltransferase domain-containing protein n=1 Tax=Cytospora paraplurivora TaxID=2898453 RepID=A0AAN9YCS9_9PEZI
MASIPALVAELERLTSENFSSEQSRFTSVQARAKFTRLTETLGALSRDAAENVYYLSTRTAQNSAVRCAISLQLFDLVPADEGKAISTKELASGSEADPLLVERLMRVLASCGVFDQVDEDLYVHNHLSRCFINKNNRDQFQQMYEFVGKGVYGMADYLEKTGWKSPEGYEDAPVSVALGVQQGGFFEYLAASPERQALFSSGMQSRPESISIAALYPFIEELNGRGDIIKTAFPDIKGRFILQDQEAVIEDARAKDLPAYIEPQAASFFQPNPVKNARAYLFRRIFHDWSDPLSVVILSNTVSAMGRDSKVLIADVEMPVQQAPWFVTLQDWNMMALGGIERTDKQWKALLTKAGLVLAKVWRVEGSNHVVVEGRLP